MTIVVCPLIALMADQVTNLHKKGVRTAACWSSSNSAKEKEEILNRLQTEKKRNRANSKATPIQLLYCVRSVYVFPPLLVLILQNNI